ncbi:MAG: DUF4249 family protein [Ignavibacteria bacterium]|nr:DUF4249 family protein [Ignavibacteria bacterium]MBT8381427.1 DUF4249 family protein [Ignavibacteria bacterium]MBT8392290.1 DUF4249 family protein [Ignavibacteria bacterium]NNJ52723.1 DUF4249 family protein [Ignavibacteriaceae bacterium]NNL20375.1 DUF4249 family protein [Ignavibacteriaceae bacterium]
MKYCKLIVLILLFVLVLSCDESFNPYGDFVERYAFNCILKSDENLQTATLFRSYRPDGFDPFTYTTDPSVFNADIRIWYDDSVFVFKDTSVVRQDTSRYKTPFSFYYNNQFQIGNRKTVELEVLLPNGRRLRSSSFTPSKIDFEDRSDVLVPSGNNNFIQIIWTSFDDGMFFLPKMTIRYNQNVNGRIEEKTKLVPLRYLSQGGESVPVFPTANASLTVVYNINAITRALDEISEGDPLKQNYSIYENLSFSVTAYDLPTTKYISSTGGSIDDLTVSVDVADYTNIEGGFGLFGSYSKKKYNQLRFFQNYIDSFGYNFIVEN